MDVIEKTQQLLADLAKHEAAEAHLAKVRFGRGQERRAALASARAALSRPRQLIEAGDHSRTLDLELPRSPDESVEHLSASGESRL